MKIPSLLLVTLISVTQMACEKLDELTQFTISYDNSVTVPATAEINLPIDLQTPNVQTNSESTFSSNDTRKDLIEEIRLDLLILTIASPESSDFSFLESISIYLDAEGLPEIMIASAENIPDNIGSTLDLEVTENDLQEYIKKDEFKLLVTTVTDEIINEDHTIDIHSEFFVNAKILGQ